MENGPLPCGRGSFSALGKLPLANLEHTFYNKYKHTFDQEGSPWKMASYMWI